jgi:hypothetical protein
MMARLSQIKNGRHAAFLHRRNRFIGQRLEKDYCRLKGWECVSRRVKKAGTKYPRRLIGGARENRETFL